MKDRVLDFFHGSRILARIRLQGERKLAIKVLLILGLCLAMIGGPHLAYTIAMDPPGSGGHRTMAKLLGLSLVRTMFTGDLIIFRNSRDPIFLVERKGIYEVYVEAPELRGLENAEEAWCWKYRVRNQVQSWLGQRRYDKVLFLDVDSLVLRNPDHLLEGDWDIAYQPEAGMNINLPQFSCFLTEDERSRLHQSGINSGTLAVHSPKYSDVMREWERIDTGSTQRWRACSDQGSWNRLIIDCGRRMGEADGSCSRLPWRVKRFERDGIMFPLYLQPKFSDFTDGTILHCLGGDTRQKIRFMFGMYMSTFFCDDTAMFLHLLEM